MPDYHELYIKYAGDIYRFALYLSGDREDAQDIMAETFARALIGNAPLRMNTVKGYLLTIARNLYLESLRRSRKFTGISTELPDTGPGLEEMTDVSTELEAVHVFLQTESEVDRSALLLRADGLTYREIADALEISLSSAKVKVHRLRLKLVEWRMNRK